MVEKLEVPTDGSKVPNIHHLSQVNLVSLEIRSYFPMYLNIPCILICTFGKCYSQISTLQINHAHFDRSLAIEDNACAGSSNSNFVIVVHVEFVEVGVVGGIRPSNCLRSKLVDVVVKVDSVTSARIVIPSLTHDFPGGPDRGI